MSNPDLVNGYGDNGDMTDVISENVVNNFDMVIGHIEDIIISNNFEIAQAEFLEQYWHHFDENEENKFIYTEIFQEYTEIIENFINGELLKVMPQFSMREFLEDLQERRNELNGEIFELLLSLSDFQAFKDLILDYKNIKEGKVADLSSSVNIVHLIDSENSMNQT